VRISLAGLASGTLVAGMTFVSSPAQAQEAPGHTGGATVEQQVLTELAEQDTTVFWVYLEGSADLAAATGIADPAAQGWYVYEQLTATAATSQADLLAMLDAAKVDYQSFWIANTVKVTAGEDLLERIAALPGVTRITADRTYQIPEPAVGVDEPRINAVEWGIDRINAPQVWSEFGVRGEGIVVGSIDTGAQFDHPALVSQYRGNLGGGSFDHNYNWHDPSSVCGSPSLVPCDNNGHGTHTMGTMVGDDGGVNQVGVAPEAKWITAKGCETTGCSQTALLSSGQFILAPTDLQGQNPDPAMRPHIVNNSWGGGADTDPWYQPTVQAWVAAGIFPQFSNGNAGPGCGTAGNPGNLVESYGAGAFDINNNIAGFSSRGPSAWGADIIKPNISAPGVNVRSSLPGNTYGNFNGTSMASPHVAGAVALMWSAAVAIERDIDTTRELLDLTAIDMPDAQCGGTPENNNVWGEGRLDAFAAVDQSPRGATGLLAGTVTDAGTSAPIGGATVSITGEVERERTTAADGTYSIILPVGDYTVTVSAFGYADQSAQVSILEDQTTTADFALEAVDSVTISGQVTDGSGHGWAMYARVSAQGTPLSTFTNPVTGMYSLSVPMHATYTLQVRSQYPGYADTIHTVPVTDSDVTVDASLLVDNCDLAPGYEFNGDVGIMGDQNGLLAAFLAAQGIPSSPLVFGGDVSAFDVIIVNRPGNPGQAAFLQFLADTDAAGTGVVFLDTWSTFGNGIWQLWTHTGNPATRNIGDGTAIPFLYYEVLQEHPILDGFEVGEEVLFEQSSTFHDHAWFGGYEGDGRMVIADAGRGDTGIVGSGIGVQERVNNRHALLSMHAAGPFTQPSFWSADGGQIFVNAIEWVAEGASFGCEPVDGGLVVGNVLDLNTGEGINGARVTSVGNPTDRGTSTATPDDPALADGFYFLFSSLTGDQEFTATANGYSPQTQLVDVVASAANEANFTLGSGLLVIEPTEVEAELRLGQSAERQVVISNEGTGAAQVELVERSGGFEMLGRGPAVEGQVRYIEGHFTPAAQPSDGMPTGVSAEPVPMADPWTNLPAHPSAVMDNSATVVDGRLYSFGGWQNVALATANVFDPASGQWSSLANLPGPRQKPGVVEIDGLIYVVGGWDGAGGTTATTLIYDPATDSWSQGANMPAGRTAPGVTVLDGQLYVVGGCTTNACPTSNTVWRYDPGADAWTTLANFPQSTAWLACAGLDDEVICAGGTDGTSARTTTFAYDPASDSWAQRADLPYDNWAMAYASANGQLVVSSGVTQGFATVTNRSAAYDPASDSWTEIEPANTAVYRAGSACGFYKVGGSTTGFTPVTNTEVHPDFTDCDVAGVDVPWLSVSPTIFTLEPGESVTVTISLDSGAVDQPGTYTAGIGVRHDTPHAIDPIGVTMVVTPPNSWGKISGTVMGADCDHGGQPLAGALVQVSGKHQQVTLFTDASGNYGWWMASNNSPLELIVAADGFVPQTASAQIRARQETVRDFILQGFC
jgi:subtilisin family serine protease/N-acetylneuraminic acid mutarotase